MSAIAARLDAVKARIVAAAQKSGRAAQAVTLVAVGKTHPADALRETLMHGQRVFGENRVQEAQAKFPELREDFPDLVLHLIGPLQTNKAREAVAIFDVIETVDREKLAAALAVEMKRAGRRPLCYVQVNTGEEPQKAGVAPKAAESFVALCREKYDLPIAGLMCIPPAGEEPAPHFALLAQIAKRCGLSALSMGMSDDFETAIQMGATHVRVGSAIFGARE